MATSETYRDHKITWRQSIERCIAHVWAPDASTAFMVEATATEGMDALRERTYRTIDDRFGDQISN